MPDPEGVSLRRDIEVIRYFRSQLKAVSDSLVLDLLERFETKPFMNAEVRSVFGRGRQTTWAKLSRLVNSGMVEKRGHVYRIPPHTKGFVLAISSALANLTAMTQLTKEPGSSKLLRVALEGVDFLYSKGRLERGEYLRTKQMLEGMMSENGVRA